MRTIGAILATFLALNVTKSVTFAHEAPSGWSYPFACCSNQDCREVPDDWIAEGRNGYRIVITGEVIPMSSPKVRHSPDGRFHWCSVAGAADSKTICLFVPARSF